MPKLQNLASRVPAANTRRVAMLQGDPDSWRAETGQSSTARGYGYKWQQAREGYLRLHPLCVMCEADGRITPATIVDHRIPHRGDWKVFWDRNNWQPLCKPHHDGEKQRQDREAAEALTGPRGGGVNR